jgi:hypothetical protein
LKDFDLNLKRKMVLKRSLKKKRKKKKNLAGSPFSPNGPAAHLTSPRRPTSPSPFSFYFALADTWAPPVNLSLPLPFLLPPARQPAAAAARNPPRPRLLPSFFLPYELAN